MNILYEIRCDLNERAWDYIRVGEHIPEWLRIEQQDIDHRIEAFENEQRSIDPNFDMPF